MYYGLGHIHVHEFEHEESTNYNVLYYGLCHIHVHEFHMSYMRTSF